MATDNPTSPPAPFLSQEQWQVIVNTVVNTAMDRFRVEVKELVAELRQENQREIARIDTLITDQGKRLQQAFAAATSASSDVAEIQTTMDERTTERNRQYEALRLEIQGWRGEFVGWRSARDEANAALVETDRRHDQMLERMDSRISGNEKTIGLMAQQQADNIRRIDHLETRMDTLIQAIQGLGGQIAAVNQSLAQLARPSPPVRLVKAALAYAADNPKRVISAITILGGSLAVIVDILSKLVH